MSATGEHNTLDTDALHAAILKDIAMKIVKNPEIKTKKRLINASGSITLENYKINHRWTI